MAMIFIACFLIGVGVLANAQAPVLVEGPVDMTATVGETVSFDCEVTHTNGYSFLWSKTSTSQTRLWINRDGSLFPEASTDKFAVQTDEGELGYSLEISNLQLEDSGVYECSYESSVQSMRLGSARLTVLEVDTHPTCSFVEVPSSDNGVVVDLSCGWPSNHPDVSAKLHRSGNEITPNVIIKNVMISRQSLQQTNDISEYECRWESPTTTQTTTCSFPQSFTGIKLGVDPYVNDVVVNQTARFICATEFEPPTAEEDISYSWAVFRNGEVIDLGERQKGFMKQSMRIIDLTSADNGSVVVCTASRDVNGGVMQAFGMINVQPMKTTTSAPKVTTTSQADRTNNSSLAPRSSPLTLSITIVIIMIVLIFVILVLSVLVIFMARSKLKRTNTIKFRRKLIAAQNAEENLQLGQDSNPDIIRAHSSALPLYTVPDTLMKSSTIDGQARYPLKHYLPRRQSYGETMVTETGFTRQMSDQTNGNYPNPYEDIDVDGGGDAKRYRNKSHTVSRLDGLMLSDVELSKTNTDTPRMYRGMKAASSMSTLYSKPEKPPRNVLRDSTPLNRKSWDRPGSIEDLCNSVKADTRSVRSFTISVCERDGYACVDDDYDTIEGETMMSDYMDMNPIADATNTTIVSDIDVPGEGELPNADTGPVYAQIKR